MGSLTNVVFFHYYVLGYQESFIDTSSFIISKNRLMLGKCYEHCIVSFVSYRVSGVFLSDLFLYNLYEESDTWEVLQMLYNFFS